VAAQERFDLGRLCVEKLVAAISVGIAAIITLKLGSVIKQSATVFFCSVMLSSWCGGLWPGVFAASLSVFALDYCFIPPLYALASIAAFRGSNISARRSPRL
jgi:K+-sensing histidine kinase KdpD